MKVALVCDWLTTPGGAEKVLLELHRMYPDAPIYTSQYRKKGIDWFLDADVRTGWLQIFPAKLRKFIGVFRQLYFSHLDLSEYDLVISVTGAEAKAVRVENRKTGRRAKHLCYCHVPTQYYWQMYDQYLERPGFGILNPIVRLGLRALIRPLRRADFRAAKQPDQIVTISHYAAKQIKKYYQRDAVVAAPPVDTQAFKPRKSTPRKGFVIACRQVTWKRVDLAIAACKKVQVPLMVIGDGPESARLRDLAAGDPLITFKSWQDSAGLARSLQSAAAFIFPSQEPFGMAAVEALAAGCPVIAFADGGSQDIVEPGKNGLLFRQQTVASLAAAIKNFQPQDYQTKTVIASTERFSVANFHTRIKQLVRELTHA